MSLTRLTASHYQAVRDRSLAIAEPLEVEDMVVQSMEDASPTRWHLAHTTWFFETFVLRPHASDYRPIEPRYAHMFNSYYNGAGPQLERAKRGTLSRPTVASVRRWRDHVDREMTRLLKQGNDEVARVTTVGLHHEEQHQELMVTDLKHALLSNPLHPVYLPGAAKPIRARPSAAQGASFHSAMVDIGHDGSGFAFDNEGPRHRTYSAAYRLSGELVTNREWLEFIRDGGYTTHDLWLSDAWALQQRAQWRAPLYWVQQQGDWSALTLGGARDIELDAPVSHVSFFEADAYARWAGARLPTEVEWERAAEAVDAQPDGTFLDDGVFHPVGAASQAHGGMRHMLGEVWEWTSSPYRPYPGFKPLPGTLGEYNGKFMNGQYVLRGGSCATARDHVRRSYRNFFGPNKRWQFSGLRLAYDL